MTEEHKKESLLEQNSDRFLGIGEKYDSARSTIPLHLCETVITYLKRKPRIIVDMGCGTGLSTRPWVPYATEQVIGIDPNPDMIEQAKKVSKDSPSYRMGYAHETGLPDGCADIILFASAFHWVDHKTVIPEIERILAPGGVLLIIDAIWPPSILGCWKTEKAFDKCLNSNMKMVVDRGYVVPKDISTNNFNDLKALEDKGTFAWVRRINFSSEERGDWRRLIMLMESCSPVNLMLSKGASRDECILTELEDTAKEEMRSDAKTWLWSMETTIAIKC